MWVFQTVRGDGNAHKDNSGELKKIDFKEDLSKKKNDEKSKMTSLILSEQKEVVKTFLKRARAAYGRTALCLSGGAMMGNYHFGHVKALHDEGILPHIMSGTSAGSVVAAFFCTRSDAEIERDFNPEFVSKKMLCFSRAWPDRFRSVWENGCMFDSEEWLNLIKWFTLGDMTFEEGYKKTGRILCITLSATTKKAPPILVNYITAPNVTIASAVVASAGKCIFQIGDYWHHSHCMFKPTSFFTFVSCAWFH
jgi:predicted acylesterase/phospholipase RssA